MNNAADLGSHYESAGIHACSQERTYFHNHSGSNLSGSDLLKELSGKDLGDRLLLPVNMFRSGEEVLLDDVTRAELEEKLGVRCEIIGSSGADLVNAVNDPDHSSDPVYEAYELKEEN